MLGMQSLFSEMAAEGVDASAILRGTGIEPNQLTDPDARMTHEQKIAIFRNVLARTTRLDIGFRAGARQKLSDFGVYGYALASSATFGDAVSLGMKHLHIAGPVLDKEFRVNAGTAMFLGYDTLSLGNVLPIATEFWLTSILKLTTYVLEAPLPSVLLRLPYERQAHFGEYAKAFGCPVEFSASRLEWHFKPEVLQEPCPNANPLTSDLCSRFCERVIQQEIDTSVLSRHIRTTCLNRRGSPPTVQEVASALGLSIRSLHRRLATEGLRFQSIVDDVRKTISSDLLLNSTLSIEEIGIRVGFSEPSNFRKAFQKWTGFSPTRYRQSSENALRGTKIE